MRARRRSSVWHLWPVKEAKSSHTIQLTCKSGDISSRGFSICLGPPGAPGRVRALCKKAHCCESEYELYYLATRSEFCLTFNKGIFKIQFGPTISFLLT